MTSIQKKRREQNHGGQAKNITMQAYVKKNGGVKSKKLSLCPHPERFTRITLSALSTNAKLQETTPQSFLGAMMTAAQLGLEPNTPFGTGVPYSVPE